MSIVEVAALAGVSKSTVSRVLNDSPRVAPEIARTVRAAMEQAGYRPSVRRPGPKPASRKGIRSGNVALVWLGVSVANLHGMPTLLTLLHGVERALADHGLNMILASIDRDGSLPPVLAGNQQADGVLLFGTMEHLPESVRASLRQQPCVWVMRGQAGVDKEFDHVYYNNAAVGDLAAQYLVGRGHRRLAYLNAEGQHSACRRRQLDFAAAVEAMDPKVSLRVAVAERAPDDPGWSQCDRLVRTLFPTEEAADRRPSGLFVPGDGQLRDVYRALRAHGLEPGRDLDIIGCDNEPRSLAGLNPRPATIDIGLELVGRRGVQQLLWRLRHPEEPHCISVLVEPVLVPAPDQSAGVGSAS